MVGSNFILSQSVCITHRMEHPQFNNAKNPKYYDLSGFNFVLFLQQSKIWPNKYRHGISYSKA